MLIQHSSDNTCNWFMPKLVNKYSTRSVCGLQSTNPSHFPVLPLSTCTVHLANLRSKSARSMAGVGSLSRWHTVKYLEQKAGRTVLIQPFTSSVLSQWTELLYGIQFNVRLYTSASRDILRFGTVGRGQIPNSNWLLQHITRQKRKDHEM